MLYFYHISNSVSAEDLNQEHVNCVSNFMQIIFDNWDVLLIQENDIDEAKIQTQIKKYNKDLRKPSTEWNTIPQVY